MLEVPEPVPLRETRWAKAWFAVAVVAALVAGLVDTTVRTSANERTRLIGRSIGTTGAALLFLALLAWTWVNVDNARRLLTHSRRSTASPWRAVGWWLAVPLVGLPLLAAALWLSRDVIEPAIDSDSDDEVARAFVLVAWGLIAIVLWIRPYLHLATTMRRIGGDPSLFHRWIWAPFAAAILSFVAALSVFLAGVRQDDVTRSAAGFLVLGLSMLPYAVWCLAGWSAMSEMDEIARSNAASQRARRDQYLETNHPAPRP